jgi:uncharacterized protein YdhG (YjbR/CyaY superfamily)
MSKRIAHTKPARSGAKDVDKYIARVPEPARSTLKQIRTLIRSIVPPEATETISYRIPTFKYSGFLIAFAAFEGHCSLFPGGTLVKAFKKELKGYTTAKGTIRFPVDRPPPATLVRKLVKARLAQKRTR